MRYRRGSRVVDAGHVRESALGGVGSLPSIVPESVRRAPSRARGCPLWVRKHKRRDRCLSTSVPVRAHATHTHAHARACGWADVCVRACVRACVLGAHAVDSGMCASCAYRDNGKICAGLVGFAAGEIPDNVKIIDARDTRGLHVGVVRGVGGEHVPAAARVRGLDIGYINISLGPTRGRAGAPPQSMDCGEGGPLARGPRARERTRTRGTAGSTVGRR